MATDDQNKDREEDDFFGDDDDFGLPELDYEALEDDEDDADSSATSDESPTDEIEDDSESEDDLSDLESSFDDIDDDDIPDMIDDAELEAEMAEMGDDDSDDVSTEGMDDFYEEESFSDFDDEVGGMPDDSSEEMSDSVFDSDVLDEDEFKQFEGELMDAESEDLGDLGSFDETDFESGSANETGEGKGKFARVVIIGIIIFSALGILFWQLAPSFSSDEEPPVAEKKEETKAKVVEPVVAEETEPEPEPEEVVQEPVKPAPKNNTSAKKVAVTNPGEINELSARTGNYYVVIGSFLDGDMAMDYAQKLAGQGKSPSIIPPFGKAITHRVAIQGFGTLAQAQGAVVGFKAEYGQDLWILKY